VRELPLIALLAAATVARAQGQRELSLADSAELAPPQGPRELTLATRGTFSTELPLVAQRVVDLDGRPGDELLALLADGAVRVWTRAEGGASFAEDPRGELVLGDPRHSLVQLARLSPGDARAALVVADATGVHVHAPAEGGGFASASTELVPRYRQRLRLDAPAFAPIVQDVNADGRDDLVLPAGDRLEVWVQSTATTGGGAAASDASAAPAPARERFTRVAEVEIEVRHSRSSSGDELSDVLSADLAIPDLALSDVNGDGRADLAVIDGEKRAWHLVREDGAIPSAPDVTLDLAIFKDTTPAATLAPGRTLAGGDATRMETRDLDGDSIPDFVIAHRRKVWVFPGTKRGPQFTEPSTVLKAADDVTALLLLDLDADARADLVLARLQIPSIGEILAALVREWELEVECAGYKSKDGRSFETTPKWRSTIALRVPAILDIARDPESLLKRFEDAGQRFRVPANGDLDGDGKADVALLNGERTALEVWRGAGEASSRADEAVLANVLFGEEQATWDIDRVLAFLGRWADERVARVTGSRAPDARASLRDAAKFRLLSMRVCDVEGDQRAELLLEYESLETPGRHVFDLVGPR
jgi:hypothetical protein